MPPQTSEETTQPIKNIETESVFAPIHRVTKLSKTLAAVIFITLPFVGFYAGFKHQYVPTQVQLTQPVALNNYNNHTIGPIGTVYTMEGVFTDIYTGNTSPMVRYVDMNNKGNYLADGERVKIVTEVKPTDDEVQNLLFSIPYLKQVASTSKYMVFTLPAFYKVAGAEGLYKYDRRTREFYEMETSSEYDMFYSLSATSPDSGAIIVVGNDDGSHNELGTSLILIDLDKDASTTISSLPENENYRFIGVCEVGCDGGSLEWIDNTQLKVEKYHIACVSGLKSDCDNGQTVLSQEFVRFEVKR